MKSLYKKLAIVSVVASILIFAGFATGFFSVLDLFKLPGVPHAGKVTFYAIGLAPEDTTNSLAC